MTGYFFSNAGSPWNQRLPDNVPIYADSPAVVADLAQQLAEPNLAYPTTSWNINRDSYTCPIYYVTNAVARVDVQVLYNDGSIAPAIRNGTDREHFQWQIDQLGGVRIPPSAVPCPGTDGHIAVVNTDTGELFDFWRAAKPSSPPEWVSELGTVEPTLTSRVWTVTGGGYIPDHRSHPGVFYDRYDSDGNRLEYSTWGSTGIATPVVAGEIRTEELLAGVIPHALSLAVCSCMQSEYWWPAHRRDGLRYRESIVREGTRLRLPRDFDVDSVQPGDGSPPRSASARTLKMLLICAQEYGIVVNDHANGFAFRAEPGSSKAYDYGDSPLQQVLSTFPVSSLQVIHPGWRPA